LQVQSQLGLHSEDVQQQKRAKIILF
jgi:hypothetical protein